MHEAAEEGDLPLMKVLYEQGVSIHEYDKDGMTPLHMAVSSGSYDAVKWLIDNKCDINAKTHVRVLDERCSAILIAIVGKYKRVAKLLIDSGAEIRIHKNINVFLLYGACQNKWVDIAKHIIEQSYPNRMLIQPLFNECCDEKFFTGEMAAEFILNGVYFNDDGLEAVMKNNELKDFILGNSALCTRAILNRYNNRDVPLLYGLKELKHKLPPHRMLQIRPDARGKVVAEDICNRAEIEIKANSFCDVSRCPLVLKVMAVRALLRCFKPSRLFLLESLMITKGMPTAMINPFVEKAKQRALPYKES